MCFSNTFECIAIKEKKFFKSVHGSNKPYQPDLIVREPYQPDYQETDEPHQPD